MPLEAISPKIKTFEIKCVIKKQIDNTINIKEVVSKKPIKSKETIRMAISVYRWIGWWSASSKS